MDIPFRRFRAFSPSVIILIIALFIRCGGGGGTPEQGLFEDGVSEPLPAKILAWSPPSQYTNGTPLDPVRDLDRFEIYINENGIFSDIDNEMAAVTATDSVTGQPTTSFDLSNLAPFLSKGVVYYVSIRSVALNGLKSNFSPSASFSF